MINGNIHELVGPPERMSLIIEGHVDVEKWNKPASVDG
jgi:hypothetical protein